MTFSTFKYPVEQSIRVGQVELLIRQGDITEETTDAIVNSSNAHLDLSAGPQLKHPFNL